MSLTAVFVSGRGSNLKAFLDSFPKERVLVISNKECPALLWAKKRGVPFWVQKLKSETDWERLAQKLRAASVRQIYLLGFMKIVPEFFLKSLKVKMVNLHPSVLPDFPGLNSIEKSIEAKKSIGCTLHEVTAGMDEGPAYFKKAVSYCAAFSDSMHKHRVHLSEQHLVQRHFYQYDKSVFNKRVGYERG